MRENKLPLKILENFPIPINVQMKEQIKWLIATKIIKPGQFLPPTNQLAEQLQLNRNTVNWVYNQLREEGLVSLQKGKGTQVREGAEVEKWVSEKEQLLKFVQQFTQQAREQGLDLEEVIVSTFAHHQLLQQQTDRFALRVQLIMCKEHDYTFIQKEIERLTHAEVTIKFLGDLSSTTQTDDELDKIDWIITTRGHLEEVKQHLPEINKKILIIEIAPQTPMLIDIARLKQGSKVAFIGLGKQGGDWMAKRVKEAGITQIESIPQGIDSLDQLFFTIEHTDYIFAMPSVYDKIKKLAPEKTNVFSLQLEKGSETLLKDLSDQKTP